MLKKTITYEDFDGNSVTEDFYFNLSKAELAEMQLVYGDGLEAQLRSIIDSNDGEKIMAEFKKIIAMTVGKRSADGKSFLKSPDIRDAFMGSEAYSELFMELVTNSNAASEFIQGVVPRKLAEEAMKTVELPSSGIIEGVAGDAAAQASKPQPNFPQPTPFPQSLESAIAASQAEPATVPQQETSEEPAWLREMRNPTKKELMAMSRDEMQLAMKMKVNGVLT